MEIIKTEIGNAITSAAVNHVVATTNDLYDEKLGEYQETINNDIKTGIEDLKEGQSYIVKEIELLDGTIEKESNDIQSALSSDTENIINEIKKIDVSSQIEDAKGVIVDTISSAQSSIENTVNNQAQATRTDVSAGLNGLSLQMANSFATTNNNLATFSNNVISAINGSTSTINGNITGSANGINDNINSKYNDLINWQNVSIKNYLVDTIYPYMSGTLFGKLNDTYGKTNDVFNYLLNPIYPMLADTINPTVQDTKSKLDNTYEYITSTVPTNGLIDTKTTDILNALSEKATTDLLDAKTKDVLDALAIRPTSELLDKKTEDIMKHDSVIGDEVKKYVLDLYNNLNKRIDTIEGKINNVDAKVSGLTSTISKIEGKVNSIDAKLDGLISTISKMEGVANSTNANVMNVIKSVGDLHDEVGKVQDGVDEVISYTSPKIKITVVNKVPERKQFWIYGIINDEGKYSTIYPKLTIGENVIFEIDKAEQIYVEYIHWPNGGSFYVGETFMEDATIML